MNRFPLFLTVNTPAAPDFLICFVMSVMKIPRVTGAAGGPAIPPGDGAAKGCAFRHAPPE
jgi:hypothetical protein